MKILLVGDIGERRPPNHDYSEDLKSEIWESEAAIIRCLKRLGHQPSFVSVYDSIDQLLTQIKDLQPDIVFNLCEAFKGKRQHEIHIAGLFELLELKKTGADSESLMLCKDKGLSKKILTYHRIKVPKFLVSRKSRPLKKLSGFCFPAFIKPLGLEASEGIAQMSFAQNESDALDRIRFIHEKLNVDAIVEEFIVGREIYVGALGKDRVTVLPPRELFFNEMPESEYQFATFRAKWDVDYRKKWGIKTGPAKSLEPKTEKLLQNYTRKIFHIFNMRGYARMDFRVRASGEVIFIEANPNPSIAPSDDLALAARSAGINFDKLINRVLSAAV